MQEREFTLVFHGELDAAALDALFEVGCDDATVGDVDGVGYADFIREAESFDDAIRSAISQVESVPGLTVTRVEPDDLVTLSEIAQRLGRSRESVRLLAAGERGLGGLPGSDVASQGEDASVALVGGRCVGRASGPAHRYELCHDDRCDQRGSGPAEDPR